MRSPNTHLRIDPRLVGTPGTLSEGAAEAHLSTTAEMAADARGLVHGGFVFGLADYAAMLAVNDPNVVLGAAETRFLKPVEIGQRVTARATVESVAGKKHVVRVSVVRGDDDEVMSGTFTCFVLGTHVLDAQPKGAS